MLQEWLVHILGAEVAGGLGFVAMLLFLLVGVFIAVKIFD
jgi:hypothetical protein